MIINRSHKAKRLIALFLMFITVFALLIISSCQKTETDKKDETASVQPQTQEPIVFQNGEIWFYSQFDSMGEPPFSLPEGSPDIDQGYRYYYSYDNISEAECDSFISNLENSGFELVTMKNRRFLFRDDCMIFLKYKQNEKLLTLIWYSKSQYAKDDGDVSSFPWYDGKDSLSKIKIHPIDVTPEGFYELTGGQMFAIPVYSFDTYKDERLMFEDNEWYDCSVCFVKDGTVLETSMESVAVCDVDGDRTNDVLLLSFGPTSGVFTFNVTVVTKDGIFDTIFLPNNHLKLSFANKDGQIVVEGVGYDQIQRFFNIALKKDGYEPIVMLYEDGKPLQYVGSSKYKKLY